MSDGSSFDEDFSEEEIDREEIEVPKKPGLFSRLFSRSNATKGQFIDETEDIDETKQYTLTWSQPKTRGQPPTPRQGHSLTYINGLLYLFGGSDGKRTFDTLFVLDPGTLSWSEPAVHGAIPKPRQRHCGVALPNESLLVWGGIGGGNESYMLETESLTWFQAKVSGTAPSPRWGHTAVLVEQSVMVFGGHDGHKALDELWELDLTTMTWSQCDCRGGKIPTLGSRHTITKVPRSSKVLVFGGSDSGSLQEIALFDKSKMRWYPRETVGAVPPARSRHSSIYVGNSAFIFGGVGNGRALNDSHTLDVDLRWSSPAISGTVPPARMDHAVDVVTDQSGTRMFVFGGHDGQRPLNDLFVLISLAWNPVDTGETHGSPRIGLTATAIGDQLFYIGGAIHDRAQNDVRIFDMIQHSWETPRVQGVPPKALVAHTAVAVGAEIVVFGGGDGRSDGNGLAAFDTLTSSWEEMPSSGPSPRARYGHAAVIYEKQMFVCGGYSVRTGYSNELFILDMQALEWSAPYVNGFKPQERVGHTMNMVESNVFLFGGSQSNEIFDDLHILDVITMTWTQPQQDGTPPYPCFNHAACVAGTKIFYFGGIQNRAVCPPEETWRRHGANMVTDTLAILDTTTMSWDKPTVAGEHPAPRFRHAMVAWHTSIIVFGGHQGGGKLWSMNTGIPAHMQAGVAREKKNIYQLQAAQVMEEGQETTILDFLKDIGLEKYARAFVKAEIDWDNITELEDSDLREMGITALGPRKKLLAMIKQRQGLMKHSEDFVQVADLYQRRYQLEGATEFGLSSVKTAKDIKTGKIVALKFVSDIEVWRKEVTFLRDLRSEYVVDLIDFYEDPGMRAHCIVTEYSPLNLASHVKKRKLDNNERRAIIDRMARVLEYLHLHNLVHADFRTSLVNLFGLRWKIVDLSTAVTAGRAFGAATMAPQYMTPEAAKAMNTHTLNRLRMKPVMDVWALGCILVELFTRKHFLRSDRSEVLQLLQSYTEIEVPEDAVTDPQARHLAIKMLCKTPLDRASVTVVIRHAYLTGGLDTEQIQAVFGALQKDQTDLTGQLLRISDKLTTQQEEERVYIQEREKQSRIIARVEKERTGGDGLLDTMKL